MKISTDRTFTIHMDENEAIKLSLALAAAIQRVPSSEFVNKGHVDTLVVFRNSLSDAITD